MKYKSTIILILAIFVLFSITGASASDVNDTAVASEDSPLNGQMNENQDMAIDESTLKEADSNDNLMSDNTSENRLEYTDNNDMLKGSTVVTEHTFLAIRTAILTYDTIYLEPGTYSGEGSSNLNIDFRDNIKIIGESTILDGQGSSIILSAYGSNIVFQNITFKNGNSSDSSGGAIQASSCTMAFYDCIFANNTAKNAGGAIDAIYCTMDFYDCTFANNTAECDGGAVEVSFSNMSFYDCIFANNTSKHDGGAVDWENDVNGVFSNCTFENNTAEHDGGAIYSLHWGRVALDRCVFKTSSDTVLNAYDFEAALNVSDFISTYNSGEKLKIEFTTNCPLIKTANITMEIYNKDTVCRNCSFLSDDSWTVDLPIGIYIAFFKTVDYDDEPVNATIKITDGTTFSDLDKAINGNDLSQIILDKNYTYNSTFDSDFIKGIEIARNVTIDSMAMTINGDGKARIFKVTNGTVTFKNINFINGFIYENNGGGAIYNKGATCIAINCNFTNNTANRKYGGRGGAMYECTAINCTFQNNTATGEYGGSGGAKFGGTAINCTFQNNKAEPGVFVGIGGAMCYGTAINCNFTNNTATDGGAMEMGTAINCTFQNNHGTNWGGAKFGGTAINCTFTNNTSDNLGGAMHNGIVINCTFTNNTANYGGAIGYTTAITCIFINNTATIDGGAMTSSKAVLCQFENNTPRDFLSEIITDLLKVSNFTTPYKSGEKLLFSLKYEDYVFDGLNTTISIYQNDIWKDNYTTLSGQGCVIDLEPGIYTATLSVNRPDVNPVNITVEIPYTFGDLNRTINGNDNATIDLWDNYAYSIIDGDFINGIEITRNLTIDGHGITINGVGKARIFNVISGNVTFKNINFINGFLERNMSGNDGGGAIYHNKDDNNSCIAINCNFTNNTVTGKYGGTGGAIAYVDAINCAFTNNSATGGFVGLGGAIYRGDAINCNFTNNTAILYGGAMSEGNAINCTFQNNKAQEGGAMEDGTAINCTFQNNKAQEGGGIRFSTAINCTFQNNKADYGGAIYHSTAINCTITNNTANYGGAMASGTAVICQFENNTPEDFLSEIIRDILNVSNFTTQYLSGEKLLFNITYKDYVFNGLSTTISIYQNGIWKDNYTTLSGEGWVVGLNSGIYNATLTVEGYDINPVTVTLTVNKLKTELTANAITAAYNTNKELVITLKDSTGKALSNVKVTVDLNGAKTYTTDKNGQIKVSTKGLVPKTYIAKVTFDGNTNYVKSTKDVKVTVKKATPKIIAKKKTFKVKTKTKKFTITLKDNKGKPIKNVKVRLVVKKITKKAKKKNKKSKKKYKKNMAKTNKKGKATFKVKRNKKGKYWAFVKYSGNKYYKAITKKVKIIIK